MILTLIAKRRQTQDGQKKWVNFTVKRGGAWYDVKFVNDCPPPKVWDIFKGENVLRAVISLTDEQCNVAQRGNRNVLYVNEYTALDAENEEFKAAIEAERKIVNDFREKRKAQTRAFFENKEPPASVDYPTGNTTPPPSDDDLPY